jgi:hypothetical protein
MHRSTDTCGRYAIVARGWGFDSFLCYYDAASGNRLAYEHCSDANDFCDQSPLCETAGEVIDSGCRWQTLERICDNDGGA